MDAVKGRPFDYANVPVRVHDGRGGFDADDVSGGDETMMSGADEMAFPSRTSELSISFEGEVYVFPAVTPEKLQEVLLLLGGRETPNSIPSSEFLSQVNDKAVNDVSSRPNVSRRLASLERFREKRKERSFEKKIRYSCRKEVAQRMHRKNGQFAAVNDTCQTSDDNLGSSNSTPQQEPVCSSRTCQHCGVSENSTPAMRRGPAGPRTLCNACGLMWANKGTLRDLTKGARHLFNQNDLGPLDIKPIAVAAPDKSYFNQDENRTPEQTRLVGEYGNPLLRTEQDLIEITEGIADDSSFGIENSSGNLAEQVIVPRKSLMFLTFLAAFSRPPKSLSVCTLLVCDGCMYVHGLFKYSLLKIQTGFKWTEIFEMNVYFGYQETLDELANLSGTEFDIPANFDEQVDVDSHIGIKWPVT
ncbi:PREDICTED: GATA transcription factor 28-like isoform X2 [Erythranthe guttata]|uniref:GATA transcription factor 28-like isoform X2 n=1 Tax=Erythranthe guttata TaxID=4155 RepID=UPI00064E03DD|nr:PREDICTED: GATA transcription factor 28-like isoform X2 [Erythranthe guttata]|eukprot:XP_012835384.1 PREDICTED: GATA transcription factor 28-like isoform X2 [Erythranthe guttata]